MANERDERLWAALAGGPEYPGYASAVAAVTDSAQVPLHADNEHAAELLAAAVASQEKGTTATDRKRKRKFRFASFDDVKPVDLQSILQLLIDGDTDKAHTEFEALVLSVKDRPQFEVFMLARRLSQEAAVARTASGDPRSAAVQKAVQLLRDAVKYPLEMRIAARLLTLGFSSGALQPQSDEASLAQLAQLPDTLRMAIQNHMQDLERRSVTEELELLRVSGWLGVG